MAAADHDNPSSAFSSKSHDFLDLFSALGLNEQLRSGMVGSGPGMMVVSSLCSKKNIWIDARSFALDQRIHSEDWRLQEGKIVYYS